MSTPTCDVTMHKMVVPYSSNVCENSLVQWNVWIHRLPRENVSTMSPALVGRNFSSVDILLTFTLCRCNVMTLLNNLSGTGAWCSVNTPDLSCNPWHDDNCDMIIVLCSYIQNAPLIDKCKYVYRKYICVISFRIKNVKMYIFIFLGICLQKYWATDCVQKQ